jgi:hypothetical protein
MKARKFIIPEQHFGDVYAGENYATETLINGNISHCVTYLKDLLECGTNGINVVYHELESIKTNVPDRYNFIKTAVFSTPKGSDFKNY